MRKRWSQSLLSRLEATFAWLGYTFVARWGRLERGYRRPFARAALRLRFAFYPLLVLGALCWLGWDWQHQRHLAGAENAIFDQVISLRPWEPKPSGRVVVVEIDECSIANIGPWPWSRQQHADLLDALDRAGASAVGFDIQFTDPSSQDPLGDETLEAMADGGNGRFVFGATRLHPDYDVNATLHASQAPSAFALLHPPHDDPPVAMLLPYGEAMRRNAALVNVSRNADGVLRDVPLREPVGDWALASLPLRLVAGPDAAAMARYPDTIRINWRTHDPLPFISAADLIEDHRVCNLDAPMPNLRGSTVLVGYTAAGLNDAKPTPVSATMPGVEVHAEAAEALLTGSAIWMPPAGFKYLLAALLVVLSGMAFFRGEPAWEMDQIFVASNLMLVVAAFVGLSAFGVFVDIFAALGFVSLCFGLCRVYAATQRGRAIGNDDYRAQFDPSHDRWLALARLRFVPDPGLDRRALSRRLREYRRRLRRFLYAGTDAVALEGIVEYKSWLWEAMADVTVLVWTGPDRESVAANAQRELNALHVHLAGHDDVLPDDGSVRVAAMVSFAVADDESIAQTRARVCAVLGALLHSTTEQPLPAREAFAGRGMQTLAEGAFSNAGAADAVISP